MQDYGLGSRNNCSKRKAAELENDESSNDEFNREQLRGGDEVEQVEQDEDVREFQDCFDREEK